MRLYVFVGFLFIAFRSAPLILTRSSIRVAAIPIPWLAARSFSERSKGLLPDGTVTTFF
jgi:hypothetical protein